MENGVNKQLDPENHKFLMEMAIEIVDLPIDSMVIFHSYVTVYHIDPENSLVLMETSVPTPMTARVELLIYQRVVGKMAWIGEFLRLFW